MDNARMEIETTAIVINTIFRVIIFIKFKGAKLTTILNSLVQISVNHKKVIN